MFNLWEDIKSSMRTNARYDEGVAKGYHPIDKRKFRKYNRFRPDGGKELFCYLPYNSLTFSFGGQVFVCSYNRDVKLGSYPANTIDQIWNGQEARKLRQHMLYNDLDYGCRHCKFFFDKEKFSNLRPLVFDKYYDNVSASFPQVFEFELSNECNLECQMCHGEVSSSIRKNRDHLPPLPSPYDDEFVVQLSSYLPHLKEAKFYGGEPFLIPIYYKIWDKIAELNPGLDLFAITNGTHWNKKIESLITELNFDIAISIDALDRQKLEMIRKNVVYDKLMDNIRRFSAICNKKRKHLSLSFTVQKDNWEQLPLVIGLCNEVNAYIYVSYLERPSRFSIADLPADELKRIREYMEGVTLPRSTQKERHNYNCFRDFKTYLDKYLENSDEKRYHDYEFKGDQLSETGNDEKEFQMVQPISSDDLSLWIDLCYKTDHSLSAKMDQRKLMNLMETLLSGHSPEDRHLVNALIRQNEFSVFLDAMCAHPVENLREMSQQSLADYKANLLKHYNPLDHA